MPVITAPTIPKGKPNISSWRGILQLVIHDRKASWVDLVETHCTISPYRMQACGTACESGTKLQFVHAGAIRTERSTIQERGRTSSLMAESTSILCKHFDALSSVTRSST